MNPKVSVIMGIYNCEKTLADAIESVLAQTYTDWELIMCDDGSKDHTYQIAESYRQKYPNQIILLKNKVNKRLAATLNRCLRAAKGEYIARMDADDQNLPERFAKEVAYLDSHPDVSCVGTNVIIFDDEGDHNVRLYTEHPTRRSFVHMSPFAHPTIMMRKKAYDALGGYVSSKDTLRAEDLDLWFRFFEKGYKGYVIQEPLFRYRESVEDYKKRSLRAAIGITNIYLKGFKRLHYPASAYPYAFKPVIGAMIPKRLMYLYHLKKDYRDSNT